MGCAVGFSLMSIIEIIYWLFVKPFGLHRTNCKNCLERCRTHYPSFAHRRISLRLETTALAIFFIYAGCRFCLVYDRIYYNPPRPEETRNQIQPKEGYFNLFDFWF